MVDATVLLQTGKRLATAAFRRQSISLSDDGFILFSSAHDGYSPPSVVVVGSSSRPLTESESVAHMLSHINLLLRRRGHGSRRWTLHRIDPKLDGGGGKSAVVAVVVVQGRPLEEASTIRTETSSAQFIRQRYTAASSGQKLQNSIINGYGEAQDDHF
ncbi:unnamed protein product [Eruca vesicaria subsp. sativa]|uniref:Uncharacterized protein n=1 Tax=Eruca vesicaria subsp. sativa TaxID=29727 RepID=A0ABC8M0U4_ERUVS|nr:unnamed protein product [Eruca vesicaria subsp. sativa]